MQKIIVLTSDPHTPWRVRLQHLIDEGNTIISVTSYTSYVKPSGFITIESVLVVYSESQH